MTRFLGGLLLLASVLAFAPTVTAKAKARTDAQLKTILIAESIAGYSGNCPCPYSTARNGSRCGGRSAYSREGGAEPLCYAKDVSAEMVKEYREAHREE